MTLPDNMIRPIELSITEDLPLNSGDYFRKALIKPTGFREYDVRFLIEKDLNYQGLHILGAAFGTLLQCEYGVHKIVVGHDFRSYSQNVKNAFVIGLLSTGMNVIDIGLAVSPSLYFAQYHLNMEGGAMITASHNANGWTGVKLGYGFSKTLKPDGISKFKETVYRGKYLSGKGSYSINSSMPEAYIQDAANFAQTGRKLKVVVATGNGTAGLYTPEILRRAGHEVIEQHVPLDWNFPNFNPNPEDIAFLKDIGERVRETGADFGVGIDGDGDRCGIVDEHGEEVFSDKIGLLIARSFAPKHPDSTFIVDVKSTGLFKIDEILKANGCTTIYWKTGHSYLKSKVQEEKALAGFEKSGHMFFNHPYGRAYDDGSLSSLIFCNVLSHADKSVSGLLGELTKSYNSPTMAPRCSDNEKYNVVEEITKIFQKDFDEGNKVAGVEIESIITVNGARVHYKDGSWGLVRASSNVPSLVVVGESFTTRRRLYDIIEDIADRLKKFKDVGEWDQYLPPYPGED
ncbi:phosphomannomutase/phosphoglucomutase [candidate division KSB1 bacterium]